MTTTYFLNCVAGNVFHTQTEPSLPTAYYVGLSTTAPAADGTGVTEPTDAAYARVLLTNMTAPEDGVVKNSVAIGFPDSTEDWGEVTHFVIYDAQTGGNLLGYNRLDKARTIQADSQISFKANGLKLSVSNIPVP